ncbi:diacylglycerol/lipid kinase family protein [Capillimicrobium parvum]|uniref:Lipid kinase YegS n=1 Tax=Capillimicrobium parvum TaxID=2884022 RepID=A0A9E6XYN6_9ACTN|nr:diacylglycerol kinase family protein [Capillimicrobium parvum]UGS36648.1 lipid kinase YegS [Capillimicrobium parvum]
MSRLIWLIVNPHSGGGRGMRRLPDAERALTALGLEHRTHCTTSLEHGRELAQEGADEGALVVTLSGDGLIGAVAAVLADRDDALLGILPGGRGNDLARTLGIPLDDVAAACAVLRDGVARPLDLGRVGDRSFVGIASLGFDSDANRIANEAPSWLGRGVYAYGALRALAAWHPARFDLEIDGAPPRSVTGYSVGTANNSAYGGGMYAAPHAKLDDGLLDVVAVRSMPKRRFLTQLLPRVFKGTHVELPEVEEARARSVRISADRPFVVYADGDPIGATPVVISVRPHALRVMAPAA